MHKFNRLLMVVAFLLASTQAMAGYFFAPYVSIRSTKSVDPTKNNAGPDNETIKKHEEYGLNVGVSFWRIMSTSLSVGQSTLTTTEKALTAVDEYEQISFQNDLKTSTDDPTKDLKITDTQNVARFQLQFDPSFWIFIMRAKVGVTAMQRIVKKTALGDAPVTVTTGPTYNPNAGVGLGVKLTSSMYFMMEYGAYYYKFPKYQPFERQLTVDWAMSL